VQLVDFSFEKSLKALLGHIPDPDILLQYRSHSGIFVLSRLLKTEKAPLGQAKDYATIGNRND
jgi:hypothetical protein